MEELIKKHGLERFGWQEIKTAPRDETYWALIYYEHPVRKKMDITDALCTNDTWWVLPHTDSACQVEPIYWRGYPVEPNQPSPVLTALALAMESLDDIATTTWHPSLPCPYCSQNGDHPPTFEAVYAGGKLSEIKQMLEKGTK